MRRIAISFLLLILVAGARAQFDTATVLGTVTDPSGAVVARCNVVLRNTATAVELTAATDDRGEYRFVDVSVGPYELKLTAQGFQGAAAKFDLTVGARQRVDVQMKMASVASSVTTTAEATQLETESSERGQVVNAREIAELPLNGREYSQLVELTAGVVPSPASWGELHATRGSVQYQRPAQRLQQLSAGWSGQQFLWHVKPGIQQPGGAVVTGCRGGIPGGDQQYKRGVWPRRRSHHQCGYPVRHQRVARRSVGIPSQHEYECEGFFLPNVGGKPALHQNQFGGNFGGPIKKDKIFYFLDYEGYRQTRSSTDQISCPRARNAARPALRPAAPLWATI